MYLPGPARELYLPEHLGLGKYHSQAGNVIPCSPVRTQSNKFVILQSFFITIFTLLKCFPINFFAAFVMRSKVYMRSHQMCPFARTMLMT